MFTNYLFYDILIVVVSGCVAVAGWKIGTVLRKSKLKKENNDN